MHLDDRSALATDQMVVMAVGAGAVRSLAIGTTDRVDLVVLFEATEVAVNRGQSDFVETFVQLLGGQSAVAFFQLLDDRGALNCRAAGAGAGVL